MRKFFGSTRRRILAGVVAVLFVYGVAGFSVAPRVLRSAVLEQVPKQLGLTASVGAIRLNPFLLRLTVEDLHIADPGGERLVGFGRDPRGSPAGKLISRSVCRLLPGH